MQKRIAQLESQVAELRDDNAALRSDLTSEIETMHNWAQVLFAQVVEHGGIPVPFDAAGFYGGD